MRLPTNFQKCKIAFFSFLHSINLLFFSWVPRLYDASLDEFGVGPIFSPKIAAHVRALLTCDPFLEWDPVCLTRAVATDFRWGWNGLVLGTCA